MNHFYLTLPSDSSSKYYPDNTTASFRTKLSERINLDGEYEFGLAQLVYPHSWFNFNNSDGRYRIHYKKDEAEIDEKEEEEGVEARDGGTDFIFSSGQFPNEETLLNAMSTKLKIRHGIHFRWNPWLRKVQLVIADKEGSVFMSDDLVSLFGFENNGPFKSGKHFATHTFDLYSNMRMLYIYSDIASYSLVGDTKAPLLRVCDTDGEYGQMVQKIFTHPQYVPLARNDFDTIEVNISNELGKPVPFEFGKSVVTLHFRRRNKLMI